MAQNNQPTQFSGSEPVGQQRLQFNDVRRMADQAGFARDFQYDFYLEGAPAPFDLLLPAQSATISAGTMGPSSSGFGTTRMQFDDNISLTTVDSASRDLLQFYRTWAESSAPGYRKALPIDHPNVVKKLTVVWYHSKYNLDVKLSYDKDGIFSANRLKQLATSAVANAVNPIIDDLQYRVSKALSGIESKLFADKFNLSYRDIIELPSLRARAYSALIQDREYAVTRTIREFLVTPSGSVEESFDATSHSASMLTMNFSIVGGGYITKDFNFEEVNNGSLFDRGLTILKSKFG